MVEEIDDVVDAAEDDALETSEVTAIELEMILELFGPGSDDEPKASR